ncbi:MAG: Ig-like domain-containing protein [Bacilli bacterium]
MKIKVNPIASQHLEGMKYDFSFTSVDKDTGIVGATNKVDDKTLPFAITSKKTSLNSGNSDLFKDNKTLIVDPGTTGNDPSYAEFDFSDQQVSGISFYYGLYFINGLSNKDYVQKIQIETSNDGTNWNSIDIKDEVMKNISVNNKKLMEKYFAPTSKVRIKLDSNFNGKSFHFAFDELCLMADKNCHNHVVAPENVEVESVTISSETTVLRVGKKMNFTNVVAPSNATDKTLTFISSNKEVADFENGELVGKKAGTTDITATSVNQKVSNTITITVEEAPVLNADYVGIYKGCDDDSNTVIITVTSNQLVIKFKGTDSYTLSFEDYKDNAYIFKDENGNTVSLRLDYQDKNKLNVTAKVGTYTINAHGTHEGLTRYIAATALTLSPKNADLTVGDSTMINVTYTPTDATGENVKDLTWDSSDKTVGTNDENGFFTAKKAGDTTITATNGDGIIGTVSVTVKEPKKVTQITLTAEKTSFEVGTEVKVTANIAPSDAKVQTLTWSTSDKTIATVNATGVVKGVKAGKVTITALANDGSKVAGTIDLTVTASTGVIPGAIVGTWTGEDSMAGYAITITIASAGNLNLVCAEAEINFDFTYKSVSGKIYQFTNDTDILEFDTSNNSFSLNPSDGSGYDSTYTICLTNAVFTK